MNGFFKRGIPPKPPTPSTLLQWCTKEFQKLERALSRILGIDASDMELTDTGTVLQIGLKPTGVVPGTYPKLTVDAKGRTTEGFPQVDEDDIALSDVETLNVSDAQHGLAPKSPGNATTFLNGAATPDYAQVKDSDLSLSDVTDNDVSTTKHGFAPKLPAGGTGTKYLDDTGTYSTPAGSGGSDPLSLYLSRQVR